MTFDSIINNLKHFVFIVVPLSITATYVGVLSFYTNFGIDITTYLGFQDLTIIYSKYTIIVLVYMGIFYIAAKDFLTAKETGKISYWEKTILSTKYKRRIIPSILIIGTLIYFTCVNETSRFFILFTIFCLLVIGIAESSFSSLFLKSKYQSVESTNKDKFIMILLSIFIGVFAIPVTAGYAARKFTQRESVIIHLENNKIIDAQKISNLKFIGKTSAFIFIQDSIENKTIVFPIDKVMEIVYCDSN